MPPESAAQRHTKVNGQVVPVCNDCGQPRPDGVYHRCAVSAARYSRFDKDPEALAWARSKVMHEVERMRRFEQQATERGSSDPTQWRRFRVLLERSFIGGSGCVIASFDERLPGFVKAFEEGSSADF